MKDKKYQITEYWASAGTLWFRVKSKPKWCFFCDWDIEWSGFKTFQEAADYISLQRKQEEQVVYEE